MALLMALSCTFGQDGEVHGYVTDASAGEALVGVNVIADSTQVVSTDTQGRYTLKLPPGQHVVSFRYIGFREQQQAITIVSGEALKLDIRLEVEQFELGMAVITAGKFRQDLSDITVSMEVIRAGFIENTNTVNLETAVRSLPGIDVLDGQASIRGGSGYSFGAGSRVQLMVDEVPMLTADVNEVKWNFIPVENIERVEVMKGASSALYGSSALNGVINVLTAWPDEQSETTIDLFGGMFTRPKRDETAWWWDGPPLFGGGSFSTSHRLGNVDLVAGASALSDEGYREENYEERIRANVKLRHRPESVKGLTYGLSSNIQWQNSSDFLIWQNADSGAFLQNPSAISPTRGFRFNADPWVIYYDKSNSRHSLRTRFYRVSNRFVDDPAKDNGSDMYYGEYQFYKQIRGKLNLTAGMMGMYGVTNAELYGDHYNSNIALFTQFDYAFSKRFSASLGLRWEHYTLDNSERESSPVVRAGLNYKATASTFLRASFGQGYRFPSIAEKYTATTVGSLNIFPNPLLQPETGWSAEIGAKQGLVFGEWKGMADVAAFWTEYQDMIEFTFGVWLDDSTQVPTLDDLGFKSLNVGEARINGIDINFSGSGQAGRLPLVFFAGYTWMNPVDLSSDTLENNILKYRYRHSVKGDVEINPGKFSAGITFLYNSFMERIDEAFEATIVGVEIFPGLKDYRLENNTGALMMDLRFAYQLAASVRLSLLARNLLNKEYMGRPGDIQPPRNITFRVQVKL
jgi:iron complex outermembrane receptor protein